MDLRIAGKNLELSWCPDNGQDRLLTGRVRVQAEVRAGAGKRVYMI